MSGIKKVSPSVLVYPPVSQVDVDDPSAPTLILLATWMDARDVHINKYITRYQALFPTATILVTKSTFRYYFTPSSARREVEPAVHILHNVLENAYNSSSKGSSPRLLIHIFSNGGSCMLYHLYNLYAENASSAASTFEDGVIPTHVTIFDSVPGRWSYNSVNAVLASLPRGWIRTLAFPLVHLLGTWWAIKYLLLKFPEETHVWGLSHNDSARVQETCRSYAYSEADEFVDHRAVEEHADHAEARGFVVVKREKFEGSMHVAHARAEPERYWCLVKETWDAGCKNSTA